MRKRKMYGRLMGPQPISVSLKKVEEIIGSSRDVFEEISRSWAKYVGENIAAHTSPLHISEKTLVVTADSKTWAMQIEWLGVNIVKSVNHSFGESTLDDIRVVVG